MIPYKGNCIVIPSMNSFRKKENEAQAAAAYFSLSVRLQIQNAATKNGILSARSII
jgi:hypothetical protein